MTEGEGGKGKGQGYVVAEAQGDNPGRQIAQVATESCDILKIIVSELAHKRAESKRQTAEKGER